MAAKKKNICEHLNVETQTFGKTSVAVCKDCLQNVDPKAFEVKEALRNAKVADPGGEPVDLDRNGFNRLYEYKVPKTIKLPDTEEFFPLFNVRAGDIVIVLRKRGSRPLKGDAAPTPTPVKKA